MPHTRLYFSTPSNKWRFSMRLKRTDSSTVYSVHRLEKAFAEFTVLRDDIMEAIKSFGPVGADKKAIRAANRAKARARKHDQERARGRSAVHVAPRVSFCKDQYDCWGYCRRTELKICHMLKHYKRALARRYRRTNTVTYDIANEGLAVIKENPQATLSIQNPPVYARAPNYGFSKC